MPVLMIGGKCSCFRANPAHFSGHLPPGNSASHPQMPQVVRSKFDLFPFFELALRRRKKLVPLMIKGRAVVWSPSSSEEQRLAIIEIFELFAALWIVFCSFCPNVVVQISVNAGGEVNSFLLIPTTSFVLYQRTTSMPSGSVAPCCHLNDFAYPCSSLPNKEQNDLILLKRGVLDHVINGFANPLLHNLRL